MGLRVIDVCQRFVIDPAVEYRGAAAAPKDIASPKGVWSRLQNLQNLQESEIWSLKWIQRILPHNMKAEVEGSALETPLEKLMSLGRGASEIELQSVTEIIELDKVDIERAIAHRVGATRVIAVQQTLVRVRDLFI